MAITLFRIDHLLFEPKRRVFLILFFGKSEAVVRDVPLGLPATQRPGPDVVKAIPTYSHKNPHRSGGGDNAGMPHACHGDLTNSSSEPEGPPFPFHCSFVPPPVILFSLQMASSAIAGPIARPPTLGLPEGFGTAPQP